MLVALLVGERRGRAAYPRVDLLRVPVLGAALSSGMVATALRLAGVAVFVLVLAAGLFGDQEPTANLAPTFVWVVWWVGLLFVTALVGDLWRLLDPWRSLFLAGDRAARWLGREDGLDLGYTYPGWGMWPAVVLYAAFVWVEVVFSGAPEPRTLAVLAIAYSAVAWTGMAAFGADTWRRYADPFALLFGIVARAAPTELRVRDPEACADCDVCDGTNECVGCERCWELGDPARRELALRPPGAGLLEPARLPRGGVAFVALMLASVSFDGLAGTDLWRAAIAVLAPVAGVAGLPPDMFVGTVGLPAIAALFLVAYRAVAGAVAALGGMPPARAVNAFAVSLVPIALAYHVAHYYTLLLGQLPEIPALLSDPFGWGWALLGRTDGPRAEIVLDAAFVWYSQVALIVAGHACAVYVAHRIALQLAVTPAAALRSQRPMLALMVLYTVFSLWILAQPVVNETRL